MIVNIDACVPGDLLIARLQDQYSPSIKFEFTGKWILGRYYGGTVTHRQPTVNVFISIVKRNYDDRPDSSHAIYVVSPTQIGWTLFWNSDQIEDKT